MFAELAFVFLTIFLGIFLIDKYSTPVLIFVCGIVAYVVSSLGLGAVNEYYNGESASERNFFQKFLISARSICQHVTSEIRCYYLYAKIKEILSCIALWFVRWFLSKGTVGEGASTSPCRKKHCGLSLSLETELKIVIEKILHTYVRSWFCKLSQNTDFIREVNYVIEDVFVAVGNGISRMEKKEFLYHMIQVYLRFFRHYVDALNRVKCEKKQGTLEKCIAMKKEIAENFKMSHWALGDPVSELLYLQSFIACLVDSFGPVELMSSRLLQNVVVEVLTQNLMSPVLDLLSDPDQLNLWVLKFLKGVAKEQNLPLYSFIVEHSQNPPLEHEPEQSDQNVNHITKPKIVISTQISVTEGEVSEEISSLPESPSSEVIMTIGDTPLRSKSTLSVTSIENDSISGNSLSLNVSRSSSVAENYLSSPDLLAASSRSYSNFNLSANELAAVGVEKNVPGTSGMRRSKSADCIREMSQPSVALLPLNARNHSIRLSGRDNKTFVKFRTNCSPTADVEQAEEALEAEVPHLFEDLRIIDTEQKTEPGHAPYTLYCIQYWGIFHDISSTASAPDLVRQKVNVKRRFREFLALQSRLEDISELKPCLKGIKGPSKWLATPFSNLDKRNIAERKVFLENYLLDLCKRDVIVKSTVLQEFLAYGGDASIAFVKKAPDLNVPRIDKMIFRGFKGAIDLFKTALPNTPPPSDGGSSRDGDSEMFESADEDTSSELKFPEYQVEFTKSDPEIVENVENFFRSFGLNSSAESLYQSDLSPLDCMAVGEFFPQSLKRLSVAKLDHDDGSSKSEDDSGSKDGGNPMTDAMVDLGTEVLLNLLWLFKSERLVFFVKNLFGPLLDLITEKILEVVLQKENCAILLHVLHRAVWPEPKPSSGGCGDSSLDRGHLLNEAIREYIVEVYRIWTIILLPLKPILSETLDLLLGSVQNKAMNKCLLFHACDVIIHSLCSQEIRK